SASIASGPAGVALAIEAEDRCPEYGMAILEGVTVGPSPLWVRHRLASLGVRSINNVVDATNLLLLELGQPTHAFDLDRLAGPAIVVRTARPGERLTTLDGKDRALDPDDLVIADAAGPTALAGVMGGAGSEVSSTTTRLLLEVAYFEPRSVRRTARRHGVHSEASHRFERGIDRAGVVVALGRLLKLIDELSPGCRLVGEPVVLRRRPFAPAAIRLRSERLDALLGDVVPFAEARSILRRLGCDEVSGDEREAQFTPPGWRPDLLREADLIEEVGRVRGYDRIAPALPPMVALPPLASRLDDRLRQAAVELGLAEAVTYTFVAPAQLTALEAPAPAVHLLNPLSEERSVLRSSLLPGLLEALGRARRRGERGARLFTVGRTFHTSGDADGLPAERRALGVVLAGPRPAYLGKPEEHDLLDAKAVAHELVARTTGREPTSEAWAAAERPAHLHPRGAARLAVGDHVVGQFGLLHP
ncbi:MAG: phenylalanine--tRNA ligase subunit beta, partial [Myxococcales bacterium]